jgi:hypothetical protein
MVKKKHFVVLEKMAFSLMKKLFQNYGKKTIKTHSNLMK